jgi:hypothetical protein
VALTQFSSSSNTVALSVGPLRRVGCDVSVTVILPPLRDLAVDRIGVIGVQDAVALTAHTSKPHGVCWHEYYSCAC